MKSLKDYLYINEELDDNIFWKIDKYYQNNTEDLQSFNGLVDICRTNKSYNTDTISAYLSGNQNLSKNLEKFVDFLDDTVKQDTSINKDYTSTLHKVIKTIISNKTEGIKYTNIK